MAGIRKDFSLCETVAGALYMVCEAYGMDGCWLAWRYERHILTGGAPPYRVTSSDYPRSIKDGIDKISFEIDFDKSNPNLVKYIRFDEQPGKRKYLITQTSMRHLHEGGTNCALWIEIPKGADREGISGMQSLLKAEICCAEWKDYLSPLPETALEHAQMVIAQDNTDWLKKQVMFKASCIERSQIIIDALKAEITKLNAEVAKTELFKAEVDELKAELKAEAKAKHTATDDLERQIKSLKTSVEKQQTTLKNKTDTIAKLRRDLTAKDNVEEESDPESPTQATTKKRKMDTLATPKGKARTFQTPNTAPPLDASTPYTQSRLRKAAFTMGHGSPAVNTRGWMARADSPEEYAPTSSGLSSAPSVITVSSGSGADGDVFN